MKLVDGPAEMPSFAEGMARWLGWTEAIALSGALQAPTALRPRAPAARASHSTDLAAVERALDRVRATLLRIIERDMPAEEDGFAPHRRHVLNVQRAMEDGIGPLRLQARQALARGTPDMARLAAIDAVMETVLGRREHDLLAMMPTLLERHFQQLPGAAGDADAAASAFRHDMHTVLRAELDLRLQPVLGLIDALRTTQQG